MGGCTLCMPSQSGVGLKALRGCVGCLFFACLAWLGLSGQRGAVLRRHGLGRQVGGHALGVTPLRCSRQGGAFELAARPAGAPLKQLRPARYASALTRAHLAAALLGAHKAPEPRPASPLVPRLVRAGGAMRESVNPFELTGHLSIHDTPRAKHPARRLQSSARHPNSSACRPKTIAGQAGPRSSHPTHASQHPSHATSEAKRGVGGVGAGAWVVPRSAGSRRLPLACGKGMARTV